MLAVRAFVAIACMLAAAHVVAAGLVDPIDPSFAAVDTPADPAGFRIAADGRFVLMTTRVGFAGVPCIQLSFTSILPAGERDTAFGADGFVDGASALGCAQTSTFAFTLDRTGRVLLTYRQASTLRQVVARLDARGRPDASYGANGFVVLPGIEAINFPTLATTADGALLVSGKTSDSTESRLRVFKLSSAGTLDAGFGAAGVQAISEFGVEVSSEGHVALQPDGAIVIAWTSIDRSTPAAPYSVAHLERRLASGALDTTFGTLGRASLPERAEAEAVVLQGPRIVVVLRDHKLRHSPHRLYAFDAAGRLDTTFGAGGIADMATIEETSFYGSQIVADASGRLVGVAFEGPTVRVQRWTPEGRPDASFGADGTAAWLPAGGYSGTPFYAGIAAAGDRAYVAFRRLDGLGTPQANAVAALARLAEDGGAIPGVHRVVVVGYYNSSLQHWFMTADREEQRLLDTGVLQGWARGSGTFTAVAAGSGRAELSPVCRFYGRPEAHLDSHFYSASPAECAEVERRFSASWVKEADDVFEVYLPDTVTGACPPQTRPVYRFFNGRTDANHLFTTLPNAPQGFTPEGYGPPPYPVAMCAPVL
jgi:uncharacterized delta-60 repeat protein